MARLVRVQQPRDIAIPSKQAAIRQLLQDADVYDTGSVGNLASFRNVTGVSLPDSVADSPQLLEVLPADAHHFGGEFGADAEVFHGISQ